MSSVYVHVVNGISNHLLAKFANDGVYLTSTNTTFAETASLAHTKTEVNPWWMVDLEDVYCVWAVKILNRAGISY